MKLNHECVRDLMILAENSLNMKNYIRCSTVEMEPYSSDEIIYTATKLKEAGFIKAEIPKFINGGRDVMIFEITWSGHQFLDNIRDKEVWSKTKNALSKFSSVSVSIINNIASQVLTNLINQQLGL